MFKNVAAKFMVFAFDSATNLPKTGDSANITAYVSKDYASVTVLADTTATEMDATNAKGYYLFDAAQGETNADCLMVSAKSSTSGIVVVGAPAVIYTRPTTGWLAPTTAGRTLDVTATGGAGIDWSNVESPTTTLALTGTTIATTQKVDVDTIKTNPVVNGGTITFPTTATLASTTNITAGTVTTATNVTTVNGLAANVITATSINADAITAAKIADGAIDAATFAASAITATVIAADAITAAKIADGAIDAATFAAGAINAAAIASDAITDAKVAADVTIASVTGAVGSVTGSVGSVTGAVGSVTGAVGSVTGNVGGNVTGSVGSIATGGIAAASFAAGAIDATAIATDAIGSAELAASAATEIAAAVATRQVGGSVATDGSKPTLEQAIFLMQQVLTEFGIATTTLTVNDVDGTTPLATFTLNDATTPTAITRAT